MSEALTRLSWVRDIDRAKEILRWISDEDILWGDFKWDDLKKRVRKLIKEYHPDIPDGKFSTHVKTLIAQRINTLWDKKPTGSSREQAYKTRPWREEQPKNSNRWNYANPNNKNINTRVQEIYDEFERWMKYPHNFNSAMKELIWIEKSHNTDLRKTKNQIIKLRVQEIYDGFERWMKYPHNFNSAMEELIWIEEKYWVKLDLAKRKMKKAENK